MSEKLREKVLEQSHLLTVERFGAEGWHFVACARIPGLSSFGPDLDDVFKRIKVAAAHLLRERGEHVAWVNIDSVPVDEKLSDTGWAPPHRISHKCTVRLEAA